MIQLNYMQEQRIRYLHSLREYYQSGATKPYEFRIEQLKKLRQAVKQYEKEIELALYTDLKKVRKKRGLLKQVYCWQN